MTTNVVDEFVKYLGERHFNAASLLSKLNSAPRRNGEKTLRDLWEASDLSANDFAEEVAAFYRLPRIGLPCYEWASREKWLLGENNRISFPMPSSTYWDSVENAEQIG